MVNKINTYTAFTQFIEQVREVLGMLPKWPAAVKYFEAAGGEPNENNYWIWRELLRTYDRSELIKIFKPYTPTVFNSEAWVNPLHFVHIAQDDKHMIAYTPDAAKGLKDVHVKTTVGKYLTKFHKGDIAAAVTVEAIAQFRKDMAAKSTAVSGELRKIKNYAEVPDEEIREILALEAIKVWADKHRDKVEEGTVLFASTREECAEVYLEGPASCMDGRHKDEYMDNTGGVHPAEVYAGPDTVIAYTKRGGKINSRTVCHIGVNPPRFTRIYGDALIASRLKELGFVESYSSSGAMGLDGARLLRIPSGQADDDYVMPYLDSPASHVRLDGAYIRVSKAETEAACQTQYGHVYIEDDSNNETCACCGSSFHPRHMHNVFGGERVCKTCVGTKYANTIVDEGGRTGYAKKTDTVVIQSTRYLAGLNFPSMGMVTLLDGQWAMRDSVVRHWAGGFIMREGSRILRCGTKDGEDVFAHYSEVTMDWLLTGHDFCKRLQMPGLAPESLHDAETIQSYTLRVATARFEGGAAKSSVNDVLYYLLPINDFVREQKLNPMIDGMWAELVAAKASVAPTMQDAA